MKNLAYHKISEEAYRYNHDVNNNFVETHEHEKGFAQFYNQNIKTIAQDFERNRVAALFESRNRLRKVYILDAILFIAFIILCFSDLTPSIKQFFLHLSKGDDGSEILIFSAIAIIFLPFYWARIPITNYQEKVKEEVIPIVLKFFKNFEYKQNDKANLEKFQKSKIIPEKCDRFFSYDLIKGSFEGINFEFCEIFISIEKKYHFSGISLLIKLNKNFNSRTIILGGSEENSVRKKIIKELKEIKLEDPKFNNIFNVYGSNQIEARYFLTTSLMERILELTQSFSGKPINLSLFDDNLLIMIPTLQNLFEAKDIGKSVNFVDDCKIWLAEMESIFDVIRVLKLN